MKEVAHASHRRSLADFQEASNSSDGRSRESQRTLLPALIRKAPIRVQTRETRTTTTLASTQLQTRAIPQQTNGTQAHTDGASSQTPSPSRTSSRTPPRRRSQTPSRKTSRRKPY